MSSNQNYMAQHFFNPFDEPRKIGFDLLKNELVEGDLVFKNNKGFLLIKKMSKKEIKLAEIMEWEKCTL